MKLKQRGASSLGTMIFLILFISAILVAAKIVPAYFDDLKLKEVFDNLVATPNIGKMTPQEVRGVLNKKWQVNAIDGTDVKDILITQSDKGLLLSYHYEVRTPIVRNIDAVMSFDHQLELK